jgi:hypothetical protein
LWHATSEGQALIPEGQGQLDPDNKVVTSSGRQVGIERSRTAGRDPDPSRERVRPPPPPPRGPIARVAPRLPRTAAASVQLAALAPRLPIGFPNLRRNVCPHFYMTGPRGPIPVQTPHLLKAYMRQDATIARCQVRGGVHLDGGYVSDVCLSARFNQCVFYEEDITGR